MPKTTQLITNILFVLVFAGAFGLVYDQWWMPKCIRDADATVREAEAAVSRLRETDPSQLPSAERRLTKARTNLAHLRQLADIPENEKFWNWIIGFPILVALSWFVQYLVRSTIRQLRDAHRRRRLEQIESGASRQGRKEE